MEGELTLRYYGDNVLKTRCEEVAEINEGTRDLVRAMYQGMLDWRGRGLAAPQVGKLLRLFLVCMGEYDDEGRYSRGPLQVFINPKITHMSEEESVCNEVCLSVLDLSVPVKRPERIHIEWTDELGKFHSQEFGGHTARCIQHEYDHLDGILNVDRASEEDLEELADQIKALEAENHVEAAKKAD